MEYVVALFQTAFIDKNLVSLVILKDNSEMVNCAMMRPVATCFLSLFLRLLIIYIFLIDFLSVPK